MTAKELIEKLSEVEPDTEIISGTWNGRVDTYTVIDPLRVYLYDQVYADFYGTPGAFDVRLMDIKSKHVAYLGSQFANLDKQVIDDRRILWRMAHVLRMHRSKEWKKERIYKMLTEFEEGEY